jgi:hypothetical protein
MARISLIEPEQASPEAKQIYDGKLKGKPGSIQKALTHRLATQKKSDHRGYRGSQRKATDLRLRCSSGCSVVKESLARRLPAALPAPDRGIRGAESHTCG